MLSRARTFVLLAFALLPLTGCLLRSHKIVRTVGTAPVLNATLPDLVTRINYEAEKIQTLNATVDIATSVVDPKKGKESEYQEIRGYVLVRKPGMLRMIGLFPVVRNRVFDMVSNGQQFRLSIPPKNKFIVGSNTVKAPPSEKGLETLRPQEIMDALVLREINPQNEIAVLESGIEHVQDTKTKKEVTEPNYIVDVIHNGKDGTWLARKVFFSRTDLQPRKQIFYDKAGNPATIASYDNFTMHDNIMFPSIIEIKRPKEEYTIQLGVVKVTFNQPLRDDQFELQQPPGSQLQVLDGASYDVPIRSSQGQARQSSRVQQAQR